VDPGFEGHLVLGLANLSPRAIYLHYDDPIATLELHRLSQEASSAYTGTYRGQQLKPGIPRADADYLRTIETMSVSDLTQALLRLSDSVSLLSRDLRKYLLPIGLAILIAVAVQLIIRAF
jgi:hypothetical protein